MKKIIASVMLACFGASILIAEVPAAVAASSDPFAGVEGVELTAVEEGEVEGGFVPVAVAGVVITADVVAKALVTGGCIAVGVAGYKVNQSIKREDGPNSSVPGSQDHAHGETNKGQDWAVNKDGTAHHGSSEGVKINNKDAETLRNKGYNIPKSGVIGPQPKNNKK